MAKKTVTAEQENMVENAVGVDMDTALPADGEAAPATDESLPESGESLDELLASMDAPETDPETEDENASSGEIVSEEPKEKPKRGRKKKEEAEPPAKEDTGEEQPEVREGVAEGSGMQEEESVPEDMKDEVQEDEKPASPVASARRREAPVLTLDARGEAETQEALDDIAWHEIHNAYRTRKIMTGTLGGIEQTDNGKTIAIVDYKGFRIVIPLKEMMINLGRNPSGQEYTEMILRQNKILGNMLGAEIDFIVKGIDSKTRSVVASRQEAMLKKRQLFYMSTDSAGLYRIYEGRIVQARVIAVAEKVVRMEIFGVECSILARDLAWDWIGDAHERFSVGDQVLVRILSVQRDSVETISVKADVKSVSQNNTADNLKKCRIQSKYAGKVTDVHKGVVYIRLSNGVNAVAHSCYDYRTPGKKDDVSFAVTKLDEERGVAVGIITRIIRQNV